MRSIDQGDFSRLTPENWPLLLIADITYATLLCANALWYDQNSSANLENLSVCYNAFRQIDTYTEEGLKQLLLLLQ